MKYILMGAQFAIGAGIVILVPYLIVTYLAYRDGYLR